ncbi:MAG: DUF308 domain-containing protein [Treponema sp.]|nr:DUF308 domain-containing protein [Treponema sp.]
MTINLFGSVLCIVLGLMLSIFTNFSIKIIVIALGAAAIAKGVYDLIKLKKLSDDIAFNRLVLIRSLASIVVGLLAVFLPIAFFKTAETVIKVLLYILAIFMLISAFMQFFFAAKLDQEEVSVKGMRIEAVSYLLAAVFLFLVAAINITGIIRIVGIILVVFGAIYTVYLWHNRTLVINPDSVEDDVQENAENSIVPYDDEDSEEE